MITIYTGVVMFILGLLIGGVTIMFILGATENNKRHEYYEEGFRDGVLSREKEQRELWK